MAVWATLKPDDELREIFPDGEVPIISPFPIIPRAEGCPPCYVVKASALLCGQTEELAIKLVAAWQGEITSVEQAIDYINDGLPLRCDRFTGVTFDDFLYLDGLEVLNRESTDADGDIFEEQLSF